MPLYDVKCPRCDRIARDVLIFRLTDKMPECPDCHVTTNKVWLGKAAAVIGDEIDVTIRHGMCNEDRTPRRFRSRQELAREAKRRGMVNQVEHHGGSGSDKSKNTTRWT